MTIGMPFFPVPVSRIVTVDGDEGWPLASRLLEAVWPPDVVATLPWKDVVWAHADRRVLYIDNEDDVIGHAGMFLRDATLDTLPVKIGGVGAWRRLASAAGRASAA
jgi:hypothetical protein